MIVIPETLSSFRERQRETTRRMIRKWQNKGWQWHTGTHQKYGAQKEITNYLMEDSSRLKIQMNKTNPTTLSY